MNQDMPTREERIEAIALEVSRIRQYSSLSFASIAKIIIAADPLTGWAEEQGWVSVEDRLPEHGGQVLISWRVRGNPGGPFVSMARYEMGHWEWNSVIANSDRDHYDVQAWMQHPKPYGASK